MIDTNLSFTRKIRMAAPAPAREIVRASAELSATSDTLSGGGGRISLAKARELHIADLQQRFQAGIYLVNCEQVSASIVKAHLLSCDPYQR